MKIINEEKHEDNEWREGMKIMSEDNECREWVKRKMKRMSEEKHDENEWRDILMRVDEK